ncbi:MAG: Glycosyl transferase group 1 [Candidatus Jorgensenbacteria bacterium GW2011_GWA1_48_11]|uniref:Glycosyl transferase group 1 n=1 Tax=Candidatus Jorgensenbacteria bacterium GW2011_GWA1_48_11 TaxID=1618660 RepID=A0A0G1UBC8_9BACT|nr:MAG: Glycosyl transferase group 1 [Candidatus Jorgensenbacteria bacterium GW2011_GWA1_48_11]KKW11964.1 MAG: Glycosyl transferase group 1 [Candidatus Jorgensenbacteria bacterium GW2011_GWB1_49_9]
MKILHVVPTYLPAYRYGGPILSVHYLNKWLVKKGVEVTVFTTNINGPEDLDVPLNKPVIVDGVTIFYFKSSFPRKWFYSRDLRSALAERIGDFDLIHITSVFLSVSALGAYYAKKFHKPYVISPRGSLMKEPLARKSRFLKLVYLKLIERNNLAGAAAIHFTAEVERKEYFESGLPPGNSFIIPNAFEPEESREIPTEEEFRKKYQIPPRKKIVLFMSRLNWKKGLDTLIPAFRRVRDRIPDTVLVLAGSDDDDYSKEISKWMSRNDLKEKRDVFFTGMLLGDDKNAALEYADVFVLPSFSENFGMAAMEGLMHTVVVVTKGVAISYLIDRYKAGKVVSKNKEELSRAVSDVLENPAQRKEYVRAGRQLVQNEFSPAAVAMRFFDEYQKLVHH